MGSRRILPFLLLLGPALAAVCVVVRPPRFLASSCYCPVPAAEEYPSAYGPWVDEPTVTLFTIAIHDYSADDFDGMAVQEYSPQLGEDSCYDQAEGSGLNFNHVTGGPSPGWPVGTVDSMPDEPTSYSNNAWGYDGVGYYPATVTYYRQYAPKLPCGAQVPQNMEIQCPTTGQWKTYTWNILTATINNSSSVTNCHEDLEGDYTACQTEDH